MTAYDVIVAGLGGMGSAAAAHLSARGVRVLGVDQFHRGHAFGASTGKSRIIRKAYFESLEYIPLLERAYTLWHQLQARTGEQLYFPTGLLTIGPENGPVINGAREAASKYALDVSVIDAKDIRAKYPAFHMLENEVGVYEPDAGYVIPESTVLAHLDFAETHGAELRFGTVFKGWSADGEGVTVTLDDGEKGARVETRAHPRTVVCKRDGRARSQADDPAQRARMVRTVEATRAGRDAVLLARWRYVPIALIRISGCRRWR
jgi:sarcosine oxidase